jgi:hypothetical protein
MGWAIWLPFPVEEVILPFCTAFMTAPEPTLHLIQWISMVKLPEREADHSPP